MLPLLGLQIMTVFLWQTALVALGGAVGAVLRFLLTKALLVLWPNYVGAGTLLVNVLGSFAIGLVLGTAPRATSLSDDWKLFLVPGVFGGFTTFSSLTYETSLWWTRTGWIGWGHLAVNLVLGIAAVIIGDRLGRGST